MASELSSSRSSPARSLEPFAAGLWILFWIWTALTAALWVAGVGEAELKEWVSNEGLLSALVADAAPDRLRGTAFGVFNLATGLTMLVASALAGVLWSRFAPSAPFVAGCVFCAMALIGLWLFRARPAS